MGRGRCAKGGVDLHARDSEPIVGTRGPGRGPRLRAHANLRPPSHTGRVPQVYEPRMRATRRPVSPRLTLTPASPRAAEPTGRHPHRSPRPCLDALPEHTRPSSPPLSTKLPPSSPTVRPAPRTRRVVPLPAWGRRPPPSHTGAGPDRMPIKMCRSREPATTAGPERARISEYPPQPPTGGRGSPAPRKGSGTHRPKQSTQPAPHILLARRGSKGCWWAGMWPGVVWLVSECQ